MKSTALTTAALLVSLAYARAEPASTEPFLFDPLTIPVRMQLSETASKEWMFQTLDVSERGDFVVLAAGSATVDVWSVKSGTKTASLALSKSDQSYAQAALAGDPCVVVAGYMELTDPDKNSGLKDTPLKLMSCATGEVVATIEAGELPRRGLIALTSVPGCGLVVAQFEEGTVVVDVGTRRLRPDLAKLISDSLPVDKSQGPQFKARWIFKAPTVGQDCTIYGASLELKPGSTTIVPNRLFAFDFRAKQARLLKSFAYAKGIKGVELKQLYPAGKMAISPSGHVIALYFSRDGGFSVPFQERPDGITDLLIADTRKAQPETVWDMKNGSTVRDLALFADDELLLLDNWLDDFHVSAWDLKSRKARMLCSGGFGDIRRKGGGMIYGRRSPSAIAVNAKLGLVAAVINDHIRILRYKRNPNGVYSKLAEC